MAACRIDFCAHERNRVLCYVEESVQVVPTESLNDVLVIPFPNRVPITVPDGLAANIAWDAKIRQVEVLHPNFKQMSREIGL